MGVAGALSFSPINANSHYKANNREEHDCG